MTFPFIRMVVQAHYTPGAPTAMPRARRLPDRLPQSDEPGTRAHRAAYVVFDAAGDAL